MKIPKKFSNVLNMNNCNMSVGFFFFKIGKVVIYIRIFFLNHCAKVCNFASIELKKNPRLI